jgi:hypothetical protein
MDPDREIMSRRSKPVPVSFTARERDLIRHEMGLHFGQYPSLADGIFLRTWRGGPEKSEPKIPPAVRTMMDRGLVEIRNTERGPRAFFTKAGLEELRRLLLHRRYMDPARFAHLRQELGLEPDDGLPSGDEAA